MAIPEGFKIAQNPNVPQGFREVQEPSIIDKAAGIVEPALAIGGAALGEAAGGITGAVTTALTGDPQAGEAVLAGVQEAFTFNPRTPEGQANLESIASNEVIQSIGDTLTSVEQTLGDAGFDLAGPIGGAIAQAIPTAILEGLGLVGVRGAAKGAQRVGRIAAEGVEAAGEATGKVLAPVIQAAKPSAQEVVRGVFEFQSPAKQKIAALIEAGSTDIETAGFKLAAPSAKPTTAIGEALKLGGPRVVKDPLAGETIKQGFDPGVIAAVKGSSKADKLAFNRMVNIAEKGKKNARFAIENRPSDVVGDLLMGRLRSVQKANTQAGKKLDVVARGLKGKPVEFKPAIDTFLEDLDGIGVTLGRAPDGSIKPSFKGSDIEDLAGPEAAINRIVKRLSRAGTPDASTLHQMKRFIDEQVTFGKNAEGLAGRTERILKKLRRNIDQALDEQFPEYDKVNVQYAETISALDEFQRVAGQRMNLTGPNAQKATGTLMRRLMSNAQSRINLLDSVNEIERVAKKFGGLTDQLKIEGPIAPGLENDLLSQVLFVDELDRVFGTAAKTSLLGDVEKGVRGAKTAGRAATSKGGAADVVLDVAGKVAEKALNINEEAAFKAIKDLLKGAK